MVSNRFAESVTNSMDMRMKLAVYVVRLREDGDESLGRPGFKPAVARSDLDDAARRHRHYAVDDGERLRNRPAVEI